MNIKAPNVYLCCGNKTGVENPGEWLGIDIKEPCDLKADVRDIETIEAQRILATPECGSFTDMPWKPATNADADILIHCLHLCKMAPHHLLENNRWAQKFIGPADFHRGGHYFWGNLLVSEFRHIKMRTTGKNPLKRAALPRGAIIA